MNNYIHRINIKYYAVLKKPVISVKSTAFLPFYNFYCVIK